MITASQTPAAIGPGSLVEVANTRVTALGKVIAGQGGLVTHRFFANWVADTVDLPTGTLIIYASSEPDDDPTAINLPQLGSANLADIATTPGELLISINGGPYAFLYPYIVITSGAGVLSVRYVGGN